ncbi:MAG: hypothetical protein ABI619_10325, partial [Betaproteobacteria bacterium]
QATRQSQVKEAAKQIAELPATASQEERNRLIQRILGGVESAKVTDLSVLAVEDANGMVLGTAALIAPQVAVASLGDVKSHAKFVLPAITADQADSRHRIDVDGEERVGESIVLLFLRKPVKNLKPIPVATNEPLEASALTLLVGYVERHSKDSGDKYLRQFYVETPRILGPEDWFRAGEASSAHHQLGISIVAFGSQNYLAGVRKCDASGNPISSTDGSIAYARVGKHLATIEDLIDKRGLDPSPVVPFPPSSITAAQSSKEQAKQELIDALRALVSSLGG